MLFLLFLLQTLAASDALHLDLHADAAEADHQCAVTHFSNGKVDLDPPAIALPLPPQLFVLSGPVAQIFIFEPSLLLLPSRGPPSLA